MEGTEFDGVGAAAMPECGEPDEVDDEKRCAERWDERWDEVREEINDEGRGGGGFERFAPIANLPSYKLWKHA